MEPAFEVLKVIEKICSEIHEDTADACDKAGNKYWHLKEYDKALQYYERSLKI